MGACYSCSSFKKNINNIKKPPQENNNEDQLILHNEFNNDDEYFSREDLIYYDQILKDEIEFNSKDHDSTKITNNEISTNLKKGKLLGEGSFGKVYEAFDDIKGQMIAIKEFKINILEGFSSSKLQILKDEASLLSRLNHKNIVKFYGVISDDSSFKILLELVAGGSISKMIETYKPFPENVCKKYTFQILKGLEYLHIHGVIHRDIKGANILVDRDGICKLSDFGGSKVITNEVEYKRKNTLHGTPHWMAPEIIKYSEYSRYSDIWALGCTIIEMLSGNPPFSHFKNPMSALYNIMNLTESPELPKEVKVSKECHNFIKCCLSIEPKKRWNVRKLLSHQFIKGKINRRSTKDIKNVKNNIVQKDNNQEIRVKDIEIKVDLVNKKENENIKENKEENDENKEKTSTEKNKDNIENMKVEESRKKIKFKRRNLGGIN